MGCNDSIQPSASTFLPSSCFFCSQIVAAFDPAVITSPGAFLNDCVVHDDQLPDHLKDEVSFSSRRSSYIVTEQKKNHHPIYRLTLRGCGNCRRPSGRRDLPRNRCSESAGLTSRQPATRDTYAQVRFKESSAMISDSCKCSTEFLCIAARS